MTCAAIRPQPRVESDAAELVQADPSEAPAISVLGTPEIVGARGELKEVSKKARLTELAAYLYFNPGRHHHAMDEAVWPDVRVSASTRATPP